MNDLVYARLVEQRRAHVPAQTDIIHRAAGSRSRPATRVDRVNPHSRVPLPEVAGAAHQRAGGAGPDELLPVPLQHWAAADVPTAVIIPRRDRAAAVPDAITYDLDGDHGVFLIAPDRFLTALHTTCHLVGTPAHTAADTPDQRASAS